MTDKYIDEVVERLEGKKDFETFCYKRGIRESLGDEVTSELEDFLLMEIAKQNFRQELLAYRTYLKEEMKREMFPKLKQIEEGSAKMVGAIIRELCGTSGSIILPIGWELEHGVITRETLPDGSTRVSFINQVMK